MLRLPKLRSSDTSGITSTDRNDADRRIGSGPGQRVSRLRSVARTTSAVCDASMHGPSCRCSCCSSAAMRASDHAVTNRGRLSSSRMDTPTPETFSTRRRSRSAPRARRRWNTSRHAREVREHRQEQFGVRHGRADRSEKEPFASSSSWTPRRCARDRRLEGRRVCRSPHEREVLGVPPVHGSRAVCW